MEAGEELGEALGAERDDERETHGGVNGVAAADPAPEAKGVLGVDTELLDELEVRGDGDEVLLDGIGVLGVRAIDGTLRLQRVEHPGTGLASVRDRLERRERLGDDDDERGLGVKAARLLGHVVRVDVGDEAAVDAGVRIGLERLVGHDRAEV